MPVVLNKAGLHVSIAAPVLATARPGASSRRRRRRRRRWRRGASGGCRARGLLAQALANADARAELAESRARLVEAGDEARRRLERALHEGAHQHVVALALKLRVALGRRARRRGGAAGEAGRRDGRQRGDRRVGPRLASAVLSERGLAAALQVLAAARVPVHLRELPGRRFPAMLETTAYLLVAEAIANAASTPTRPSAPCARPTAAAS